MPSVAVKRAATLLWLINERFESTHTCTRSNTHTCMHMAWASPRNVCHDCLHTRKVCQPRRIEQCTRAQCSAFAHVAVPTGLRIHQCSSESKARRPSIKAPVS